MDCRKKSVSAAGAALDLAEPTTVRTALRAAALGGFIVYVCWNVAWGLQGEAPPSLILAICGVPAPTTGMTRALQAALCGDWLRSLAYNPFTLPTAGLLALSATQLCRCCFKRQPWLLGRKLAVAWFLNLSLAWLWTLFATRLQPESLWYLP